MSNELELQKLIVRLQGDNSNYRQMLQDSRRQTEEAERQVDKSTESMRNSWKSTGDAVETATRVAVGSYGAYRIAISGVIPKAIDLTARTIGIGAGAFTAAGGLLKMGSALGQIGLGIGAAYVTYKGLGLIVDTTTSMMGKLITEFDRSSAKTIALAKDTETLTQKYREQIKVLGDVAEEQEIYNQKRKIDANSQEMSQMSGWSARYEQVKRNIREIRGEWDAFMGDKHRNSTETEDEFQVRKNQADRENKRAWRIPGTAPKNSSVATRPEKDLLSRETFNSIFGGPTFFQELDKQRQPFNPLIDRKSDVRSSGAKDEAAIARERMQAELQRAEQARKNIQLLDEELGTQRKIREEEAQQTLQKQTSIDEAAKILREKAARQDLEDVEKSELQVFEAAQRSYDRAHNKKMEQLQLELSMQGRTNDELERARRIQGGDRPSTVDSEMAIEKQIKNLQEYSAAEKQAGADAVARATQLREAAERYEEETTAIQSSIHQIQEREKLIQQGLTSEQAMTIILEREKLALEGLTAEQIKNLQARRMAQQQLINNQEENRRAAEEDKAEEEQKEANIGAYIKQLQEEAGALNRVAEARAAAMKLPAGPERDKALDRLGEANDDHAHGMDDAGPVDKATVKALKDSNRALKEHEDALRRGRQLTDEMATPQEKYNKKLKELNELLKENGAEFQQTYDRAKKVLDKELKDSQTKVSIQVEFDPIALHAGSEAYYRWLGQVVQQQQNIVGKNPIKPSLSGMARKNTTQDKRARFAQNRNEDKLKVAIHTMQRKGQIPSIKEMLARDKANKRFDKTIFDFDRKTDVEAKTPGPPRSPNNPPNIEASNNKELLTEMKAFLAQIAESTRQQASKDGVVLETLGSTN